jgi:hypothetical protein
MCANPSPPAAPIVTNPKYKAANQDVINRLRLLASGKSLPIPSAKPNILIIEQSTKSLQ